MQDIPSDGDDDDDGDDADLLDELAELGGDGDDDEDAVPVRSAPVSQPAASNCNDGTCAGQDLMTIIDSRIAMYSAAEQVTFDFRYYSR